MYTTTNFKTKKALKEAVAAGKKVDYYQPGPFGGNEPENGRITIEGPHYPQAHTWYAECLVENGYIIKVK
jgi:hypothetical protein